MAQDEFSTNWERIFGTTEPKRSLHSGGRAFDVVTSRHVPKDSIFMFGGDFAQHFEWQEDVKSLGLLKDTEYHYRTKLDGDWWVPGEVRPNFQKLIDTEESMAQGTVNYGRVVDILTHIAEEGAGSIDIMLLRQAYPMGTLNVEQVRSEMERVLNQNGDKLWTLQIDMSTDRLVFQSVSRGGDMASGGQARYSLADDEGQEKLKELRRHFTHVPESQLAVKKKRSESKLTDAQRSLLGELESGTLHEHV